MPGLLVVIELLDATDLQYMFSHDYLLRQDNVLYQDYLLCQENLLYQDYLLLSGKLVRSGLLALSGLRVVDECRGERSDIGESFILLANNGNKTEGEVRKSSCTTGINDTGGKFGTGINDTPVVDLPPVPRVSLIQVALILESNVGCRQVQIYVWLPF